MSALKNIGKSLLTVGASAIPGVGAFLGPAVGALMSGVGNSGNQGGTTSSTSGTQSTNQTSSLKNTEPDYFSNLRESLAGSYSSELAKAQNETVYGPAQKAAYVSDQNDLAASATEAAKAGLARMGRLNSGAADATMGDIQMQKYGNISDFYSQLPFKESEARSNKVNSLLSSGMNWTGRAPVDQTTTSNSTTNSSGTQQTQQQGAPWWKSMLSDFGGAMARGYNSGSGSSSSGSGGYYNNGYYIGE